MKFVTTLILAGLIGLGAAASADAMTLAPVPGASHASSLIEKTAMIVTKRVVRRPVVSRTVTVKKVIR